MVLEGTLDSYLPMMAVNMCGSIWIKNMQKKFKGWQSRDSWQGNPVESKRHVWG